MIQFHSLPVLGKQFVSSLAGTSLFGLALAVPMVAFGQKPPKSSPWVATWGAAMQTANLGSVPNFGGKTLRQIVRTSVSGSQARIWISNRFGTEPLHIGAAHIALTAEKGAIQPGSDREITFNGSASVVIPVGATIVSDPASLHVPPLTDISVSLYFPDRTLGATEHPLAKQTSYDAAGNVVGAPELSRVAWPEQSWYFLTGLDVYAPGDSTVVAIGDSITDGDHSTTDENHRWPDFLAERLASNSATRNAGVLGVVDAGIDGNRILLDGWGPNAVSRVDRDVLARSGARYLIVLESINDIGRYARDRQPYGDLLQRLETGLTQIATQAHQHGIRVFGGTLLPYKGCGYYSPEGEKVREALNQWIRTTSTFDGVIDFEKAVRDPSDPQSFLPKYNSGDNLHPDDAGYRAMADAIDLGLFTK